MRGGFIHYVFDKKSVVSFFLEHPNIFIINACSLVFPTYERLARYQKAKMVTNKISVFDH